MINSFLKLEEGKAEEGYGKPITLKTKIYNSKIIPWVRLYDTQGFESSGYGVNEATEYAINLIKKCLLNKDPNEYIHLIWYCITGSRFEECEKEVLLKLMNTYEDKTLPIIVVYTQESKSMVEEIKKKCNEIGRNVISCPIIAKDFTYNINNQIIVQKSFGLKELFDISKSKIADAVNSSFYESFKANILDNYKNLFEEKIQNIKDSIVSEKITKIEQIKLTNFDDYVKIIKNKFFEIFKEILVLIIINMNDFNSEKYVNYINNYIDTFVIDLFKNYYNIYEKEFLTPKIIEYSRDLCTEQIEGEKKFDIAIPNKKTKEDCEIYLKKAFEEKSKITIEYYIMSILYVKIGNQFLDELGIIINQLFHDSLNLNKEFLEEKTKERFKNTLDEIKKNIFEKMD